MCWLRLSAFREEYHDAASPRAVSYSALIVIDATGDVVSAFAEPQRPDRRALLYQDGWQLLPAIKAAVMTLIEAKDHPEGTSHQLTALAGASMRLLPLLDAGDGATGKMYALLIEHDRNAECIASAVRRYHLTNRQTEVLLLAIEGANASEIAQALNISEFTAQGYIKALLVKTDSRNRTAMVAKILEWPTSHSKQRGVLPRRSEPTRSGRCDRGTGVP